MINNNCVIKRIIQFREAITFQPIILYNMKNENITSTCLFSWSTDMVCWTNWVGYDTYLTIGKNIESDFYLKVLIIDSISNIIIGDNANCNYTISIDNSDLFLKDFCSETIFSPYDNLDCAMQLQQQLSDAVICMIGIPIYYFKVKPDIETKDYTFKEYSLYGVHDVKQIKLIIPDNTMPSSNPKLTEFDFEWETDWETEISKTQFARAFGDDVIPTHRDFVYIPMMKRMWEVNSAYDEKNGNLMWKSNTWKLQLVKYNEKTNVDYGSFDDLIDTIVSNKYEDIFGSYERSEQESESGVNQLDSPKFAATNLYNIFMEDSVRKQYTKDDINILEKNYNHRSNIVTRNIYRFRNDNGCITYQKNMKGDSGTLMFIMETPGYLDSTVTKDILNFGEVNVYLKYSNEKFVLDFNGLTCTLNPFTSYMVMLKWNRDNFVSELNVYKYSYPENLPIYKVRPEMYYFDFEHPVTELSGAYNNDFEMCVDGYECQIHPYPLQMTNIRLYDTYLDKQESIKESVKYVTNHKSCIINDLARALDSGHGYAVK